MPDRHASTGTLPLDLAPEQAACADAASARRVQVLLPLPLTGPYDYLVPPGLEVVPGRVVGCGLRPHLLACLGGGVLQSAVPALAAGRSTPRRMKPLVRRPRARAACRCCCRCR